MFIKQDVYMYVKTHKDIEISAYKAGPLKKIKKSEVLYA